jgi:ribosome-binding protein aMBF1 (putative translation factor)
MRLTLLKQGEGSINALVDRLYPNLGEGARKRAESALLKANPQLSGRDAFRPDVVIAVPTIPDAKPKPGATAADPVEDLLKTLGESVASYRDDLGKGIERATADISVQEELLKQKDVAAAIKGDQEASALAKNLVATLRERKKSLAEERKNHAELFSRIGKDVAALGDRIG